MGDFQLSYPVNLEPVPLKSGLSEGYVRSAPGATQLVYGPGPDRGGIVWNGVLYRVMGTKLVSLDTSNALTVLGDVGGAGEVSMTYGFDRLAINSGTTLWYWDGTTLSQVTDIDLGQVNDVLWLGGYFVTTDGSYIVVTQLSDPAAVDPLKYGSAEQDPDPINALAVLRGELYALGRNTIQVYTNTGGSGFPFTANTAATVPVGCVGPRAKCEFYQTLAFTGSGRGEATAVYLLDGGNAAKISTRAIDDEIAKVVDQVTISMESRMDRDERRLLVHLPTKTLVYLANASRLAGVPVWYIATSGSAADEPYRLRNAVLWNGKWVCGDTKSSNLGLLTEGEITMRDGTAFLSFTEDGETWSQERAGSLGKRGNRTLRVQWRPHRRFSRYIGARIRSPDGISQFGDRTGWRLDTQIAYNDGKGAIVHSLELVGLSGRKAVGWALLDAEFEGLGA